MPGGLYHAETASNLGNSFTFSQHLVALGKLSDHQLFGVSLGFHDVFLHIYFGGKTHISGGLVFGEPLTHIESLFRTTKYWPGYPYGGFSDLNAARSWIEKFVKYYNSSHRHSSLRFVTPNECHEGIHVEILKNRHDLYQSARAANPKRWIRKVTRDWGSTKGTWTTPPGDKTATPLLAMGTA